MGPTLEIGLKKRVRHLSFTWHIVEMTQIGKPPLKNVHQTLQANDPLPRLTASRYYKIWELLYYYFFTVAIYFCLMEWVGFNWIKYFSSLHLKLLVYVKMNDYRDIYQHFWSLVGFFILSSVVLNGTHFLFMLSCIFSHLCSLCLLLLTKIEHPEVRNSTNKIEENIILPLQ